MHSLKSIMPATDKSKTHLCVWKNHFLRLHQHHHHHHHHHYYHPRISSRRKSWNETSRPLCVTYYITHHHYDIEGMAAALDYDDDDEGEASRLPLFGSLSLSLFLSLSHSLPSLLFSLSPSLFLPRRKRIWARAISFPSVSVKPDWQIVSCARWAKRIETVLLKRFLQLRDLINAAV